MPRKSDSDSRRMKFYLPDVNALLALLDPMHIHHESAHQWYEKRRKPALLLCSHVVNGVIRIASQPKYPNSLGTCERVRELLHRFVESVDAAFCQQDVNLLDDAILLRPEELTPSRVSDLYLLALAVANQATFVSFNNRIPARAVKGGKDSMEVIDVI